MKQTYDGIDPLDRNRFPIDPWRLVERFPKFSDLGTTETLFAVGNGYLGMRANPSEGREAHTHGTFINGFHETWPIHHAEQAYGFATTGQTMVNVPDSKVMKLYVDDEPLLLVVDDLEEYERSIDFREGVLGVTSSGAPLPASASASRRPAWCRSRSVTSPSTRST